MALAGRLADLFLTCNFLPPRDTPRELGLQNLKPWRPGGDP
jgi:hypothetical protein